MSDLVYVEQDKHDCGNIDGGECMINPQDEILDGDARYAITKADGTAVTSFADLANCKIQLITDVVQEGTPITKGTLMDILEFANKTTTISGNRVVETDGTVTKTTTFNSDGSVTEVLDGGNNKRYTKTTIIGDGVVTEEVVEETIEPEEEGGE